MQYLLNVNVPLGFCCYYISNYVKVSYMLIILSFRSSSWLMLICMWLWGICFFLFLLHFSYIFSPSIYKRVCWTCFRRSPKLVWITLFTCIKMPNSTQILLFAGLLTYVPCLCHSSKWKLALRWSSQNGWSNLLSFVFLITW